MLTRLTVQQRGFSWAQLLKKEAQKVVRGCRLLYSDAKFLMRKKYMISFNDQHYSLKEKKAMARTTTDLLKMVPFSVFIIIPGAELLLPPVLYLFPNMVPSTFVSKSKTEDFLNAIAEKRPVYADKMHRFLLENTRGLEDAAGTEFATKLKARPHQLTQADLVDQHELFRTRLAFGRMDADMLRNVCRFLCMEPWTGFKTFNKLVMGTLSKLLGYLNVQFPSMWEPKIFPFYTVQRNILMYQLRQHMNTLRTEDLLLLEESIAKLDAALLVTCCRERAIHTTLEEDKDMRRRLREWVVHSTHPVQGGRLRNEVLLFGQIFGFLQDRIDVQEEEPEQEQQPEASTLFEESMERILHYKADEMAELLNQLEEMEPNGELRGTLKERLEEAIDEKLFFDQEERVEGLLKRLNEQHKVNEK